MAQKRPLPAPIFNKGKRQRHALLAHPNNHGGISHEAIHLKDKYQCDRSYSKPSEESSYAFQQQVQLKGSSTSSNQNKQHPQLYKNSHQQQSYTHPQQSYENTHPQQSYGNPPHQSYENTCPQQSYDPPHQSYENKRPQQQSYENKRSQQSYDNPPHQSYENKRPQQQSYENTRPQQSYKKIHPQQAYENTGPQQSYGNPPHQLYENKQPQQQSYENTGKDSSFSCQSQSYGKRHQSYGQPLKNQSNQDCVASKKQYLISESRAALGSASTQAQEPTERASAQPRKLRPCELRVITATAQGVQHWSQYREHTQLLFEVYGTLSSAPAYRSVKTAQEFSIKSLDGILQCIYWEMESRFPAITQGTAVRIVGGWDAGKKKLKCFSVRPTKSGEEKRVVKQCVMVADRHMRRLVGNA